MKNSLKKAFFGILALSMVLTMSNGVTTFAETEEPTVAAVPADTDSDSEVTTITTNPITLKVGVSSRSMTCTYVEELVRAVNKELAGGFSFGIWDNADGTPRAGSYDPEFFELKEFIGIIDETTGKQFTQGYYTPAEMNTFWKACDLHADAGITFAEEGTGDAFCRLCPKKTGSTVVTTDPYTVNGKEYTVQIPVNIVDSSEDERDKAPTWEEACVMKPGKTEDVKKDDTTDAKPKPDEGKKDDTTDSSKPKPIGTDDAAATASTSAAGSSQVSFTDTNKVLPEGAKLTSTKLESGTAYDAAIAAVKAAKTSSQTAVYAFDLTDASNAAIHELGGMIAVTVPAPFTVEADHELHVYRLNETDNSLIACDVTVNADGTVTFLTNHFSTYIFTSEPKAATAQTPQNVNPTSPGTGDNTNVYVWLYVIASLLFIGLIGVIIKEKRA